MKCWRCGAAGPSVVVNPYWIGGRGYVYLAECYGADCCDRQAVQP